MTKEQSLQNMFRAVHDWAKGRCSLVPKLDLKVGCREIETRFRRGDARAFFHVGHLSGKVCASSRAFDLPRRFLVGLMLHEIGHPLAMKMYGASEQWDADRSIWEGCGIRIRYGGPLILEYVTEKEADKILGLW